MSTWLAPVRGGFTLISEEDVDLLGLHPWGLIPRNSTTGGYYVGATVKRKTVYLHRLILKAEAGQLVDHANGDGLDNSRGNLRLATASQNCANRRGYSPRSGFRGVYAQSHGRTWQVKLCVSGQITRGGNFADPAEAARKYDQMAREHFGEFATLNFPLENK